MKYRPDIDGLRAIAILLVLIYHGKLSFFPSGFIGVDVFFVISGFLITRIIHESLNQQSFSFLDFYNRRLWRLQPVFLCFLFSTTVLTLLFFLPDDLIDYGKSARKTSLFISNVFFDKVTTNYFSPAAHQLPLLHTWSLSIEWQCYLLLPLVIYCLQRFLPKNYWITFISALTFISFLYSLYLAKSTPAHTYYLFSSRIFEFLIGSCIALIPCSTLSINKHLLNLIGGMALITLLYLASLNPSTAGYPNGYAFTVCFATGLLIVLGSFFPKSLLVRFLSNHFLVFIGLLSYSLYIWHWLVFSLIRYQGIKETPTVLSMAYGFTFLLAYLSWRFIEKPAQKWKHTSFPSTLLLLFFIPLIVSHISSTVINAHHGFPQRFNHELVTVYQQLKRYESKQRLLCTDPIGIASHCNVGSKKANSKKAFMIGDSFSNHYWKFMDVLGHAANISISMQEVSSCITLPEIYLYDWWHFKKQVYQQCYDQTEKYYQFIQSHPFDYVIIGQVWNNYLAKNVINHLGDKQSLPLAKKRLEHALNKALEIITSSGAKPVLIKSTAVMQEHTHDCFFKHIKQKRPYDPKECDFNLTVTRADQWYDQLFKQMQRNYPQLIIIDPKKVQCIKGICKSGINGVPVYRDVGHITDYASYQLGTLYLRKYKNPLG